MELKPAPSKDSEEETYIKWEELVKAPDLVKGITKVTDEYDNCVFAAENCNNL